MGCSIIAKGKPKKRYTPEFKKLVVETHAGGKTKLWDSLPLGGGWHPPGWPGAAVEGGRSAELPMRQLVGTKRGVAI